MLFIMLCIDNQHQLPTFLILDRKTLCCLVYCIGLYSVHRFKWTPTHTHTLKCTPSTLTTHTLQCIYTCLIPTRSVDWFPLYVCSCRLHNIFSRSCASLLFDLITTTTPTFRGLYTRFLRRCWINSTAALDCGANGCERGTEPAHYAALPGTGRSDAHRCVEEGHRYACTTYRQCLTSE